MTSTFSTTTTHLATNDFEVIRLLRNRVEYWPAGVQPVVEANNVVNRLGLDITCRPFSVIDDVEERQGWCKHFHTTIYEEIDVRVVDTVEPPY